MYATLHLYNYTQKNLLILMNYIIYKLSQFNQINVRNICMNFIRKKYWLLLNINIFMREEGGKRSYNSVTIIAVLPMDHLNAVWSCGRVNKCCDFCVV